MNKTIQYNTEPYPNKQSNTTHYYALYRYTLLHYIAETKQYNNILNYIQLLTEQHHTFARAHSNHVLEDFGFKVPSEPAGLHGLRVCRQHRGGSHRPGPDSPPSPRDRS